MSLVGPRPEVRKYVDLYSKEQLKVLSIRPGITDYASIEYSSENEILGKTSDPEKVYINEIMPAKLSLNLKYLQDKNFITDVKILFATVAKVFKF
jgi:lipopolysaccharide/colanic/teichoic acid biosynthesis glycosyltransferase